MFLIKRPQIHRILYHSFKISCAVIEDLAFFVWPYPLVNLFFATTVFYTWNPHIWQVTLHLLQSHCTRGLQIPKAKRQEIDRVKVAAGFWHWTSISPLLSFLFSLLPLLLPLLSLFPIEPAQSEIGQKKKKWDSIRIVGKGSGLSWLNSNCKTYWFEIPRFWGYNNALKLNIPG